MDWYSCDHEWEEPIDSMWEMEVVCTKCGCHGDRDRKTSEVYWPAT